MLQLSRLVTAGVSVQTGADAMLAGLSPYQEQSDSATGVTGDLPAVILTLQSVQHTLQSTTAAVTHVLTSVVQQQQQHMQQQLQQAVLAIQKQEQRLGSVHRQICALDPVVETLGRRLSSQEQRECARSRERSNGRHSQPSHGGRGSRSPGWRSRHSYSPRNGSGRSRSPRRGSGRSRSPAKSGRTRSRSLPPDRDNGTRRGRDAPGVASWAAQVQAAADGPAAAAAAPSAAARRSPAAAAATASPAGANANAAAKAAKRPNPLLGVVHTSKPRVAAPDGYEWDCIDAKAGSWVARRRT